MESTEVSTSFIEGRAMDAAIDLARLIQAELQGTENPSTFEYDLMFKAHIILSYRDHWLSLVQHES